MEHSLLCSDGAVSQLHAAMCKSKMSPKEGFLPSLVEELSSQDDALEEVAEELVNLTLADFDGWDCLLDSQSAKAGRSLQALSNFAGVKKAAKALVKHAKFLMPPESSDTAKEMVSTSADNPSGFSAQQQHFMRMMNLPSVPPTYPRRSGPALEKSTVLGVVLSVGLPFRAPLMLGNFQNPARLTMQQAGSR